MKSLSRVRLLATPWTAAHQAPPSMGFSKQEYWSGVPLPSPRVNCNESYNLRVIMTCPCRLTSYNNLTMLVGDVGGGNGTPLQYSCLENPMDGGAWKAAAHGVAKSRTRQSDFTFTFHFHALEKEMATHSSVLTWRIPGMGEPGGLPSLGSHRVRHD